MNMEANTIDLLFGGMKKLGPGDDTYTLKVLKSLPVNEFSLVVDAGCGAGRQTLVLSKELKTKIHAVDNHEPFLNALAKQAKEESIDDWIQIHCMDIARIPDTFKNIDLLWSEGAAYNIGFSNALITWATALNSQGLVVVTELTWLSKSIPVRVKHFFESGYPDMKQHEDNIQIAEKSGYRVLDTVVLPQSSWVEGYYDLLEPRAKTLMNHEDPGVREFSREILEEIEIFKISKGSYGYVFYILQFTKKGAHSIKRSEPII